MNKNNIINYIGGGMISIGLSELIITGLSIEKYLIAQTMQIVVFSVVLVILGFLILLFTK